MFSGTTVGENRTDRQTTVSLNRQPRNQHHKRDDDDDDYETQSAVNQGCCCHSGQTNDSNDLDNRDDDDELDNGDDVPSPAIIETTMPQQVREVGTQI